MVRQKSRLAQSPLLGSSGGRTALHSLAPPGDRPQNLPGGWGAGSVLRRAGQAFQHTQYHESPASDARMSHVMRDGLMLQTKNAFSVLEGAAPRARGERFSNGEIDFWVESLRKLLYAHIRDELKYMEAALPKILQRLAADMRLPSAAVESVAKVLRGEALAAAVDTQTVQYDQLWPVLEGFFAGKDDGFCKLLDRYRQASRIFIPLPTAEAAGHPGPGPAAAAAARPSLQLAARLREIARSQRLPLDEAQDAAGRGGGGAKRGSELGTSEVVLCAVSHLWDKRGAKYPGSGQFRLDLYAASSEELHGIAKLSAAIVKNERSSSVHFDVFTALDDQYGPTIMEIDEGRHNVYNCVLAFLIFIFKSNSRRSVRTQDLGGLRQTAESILADVFRSRLDSATTPFAVEEYLQRFVRMD